jgi:putative spermidine/putrescine transport system substrate-binding protein
MSIRPLHAGVTALVTVALTALATLTASVDAQTGRVVVASFGGAWERDLRADLIEPFEKAHNVKVDYVVGLSSETLARVKAQKDSPQVDVIMLDDILTTDAANQGLVEKLTVAEVPNLKDLRKDAHLAGDTGAGFTFSATVLMYNREKVTPAPTSWKALWDPKYKGHVAIPHINTTYGLHMLMTAAKLYGGNEMNVQAGLAALKKLQQENEAVVYTSVTQLNTMAQQGQVWLAPFSSVWVNQLDKGGTPVAVAVPQEGIYPIFTAWSVVKGAKNRAAAMQFVNYALRKDVQEKFAPRAMLAPATANATLTPEMEKRVSFDHILHLDADAVVKQRSAWVEEWNRALSGR